MECMLKTHRLGWCVASVVQLRRQRGDVHCHSGSNGYVPYTVIKSPETTPVPKCFQVGSCVAGDGCTRDSQQDSLDHL